MKRGFFVDLIISSIITIFLITPIVSFANSTGIKKQAQLPNPIREYSTLEEIEKQVGFTFNVPEVPDGYSLDFISTINDEIVNLNYIKGKNKINYRIKQGSGDISGVYTKFDKEIETDNIVMKGNGKRIFLATTQTKNFTYSIYVDKGISKIKMKKMIKSCLLS